MKISSLQSTNFGAAGLQAGAACSWILLEDLTFHSAHGDCERLFGRPASELAGMPILKTLRTEFPDRWDAAARAALAGGISEHDETVSPAGGDPRLYSIRQFPVTIAGNRYAGGIAHELGSLEERLRKLALQTVQARQDERARLSRFLHDEVGQFLSAAGLQLDLVKLDFNDCTPPLAGRIDEVQDLLEQVMQKVRDFGLELFPGNVDRCGLPAALEILAARLRSEFGGTIRVMAESSARPEPAYARALFLIARQVAERAVRETGCSLIEMALKSARGGPVLWVRADRWPSDGVRSEQADSLLTNYYAAQANIRVSITRQASGGVLIKAGGIEK